jgi:hypothetical protein
MNFDFLKNKVSLCVNGKSSIAVNYSHFLNQRSNFLIDLNRVIKIDAVQIEPAIIQLIFTMKSGEQYFITEEMSGWDKTIVFIINYFSDFDRDAFERVKGDINCTYRCWGKNEPPSQNQ